MAAQQNANIMPEDALHDYGVFMTWLNESLKFASISQLMDSNTHLTSVMGLLRRSMLAMRERPIPRRDVVEWLALAHSEADDDVKLLIEIFERHSAVTRAHIEGMREADILKLNIVEYERIIQRLDDVHSSVLHAEVRLMAVDGLIRTAKRLQNTEIIEKYDSHFRTAAAVFENDYIFQHSMIHLSNAYTFLGRYTEAIDIILNRQVLNLSRQGIYQNLFFINLLTNYFNLGNLDQAELLISEFYRDSDYPDEIAYNLSHFKTFNGRSKIDRTLLNLPRYEWTLRALWFFAESDVSPPVGKMLTQREAQFRQILDLSEYALTRDTYPTDLLFGYWLRARTRLLLGEYGMAVQELATLFEPLPEELFNRVLLAALDLELAMTPMETLRIPLDKAEERFRQVFEAARTTRYADPESLARLVMRWHPQAAAYAALMPNPVRECLPALEFLARVDQRATWRSQALPPALIPHLTRMGLRIPTLGVTLGGNAAYQVGRLTRQVGEATVWGPVLPLLPIIVALSRGGDAHLEAARRAWRDFGMLPGSHRDPQLAEVVEVWRAVVEGERPFREGLRALQDL